MITMADIAERANVGRSTVSHVLNNRGAGSVRIPDATRQRILEVAREMGYRHNELARSVASGKSRMIGYLVEEPRYEPYWNTVIGSLTAAEDVGFTLKVLSVNKNNLRERISQCIALRLGGVIVRVNGDKSLIFEEANRAQIPVVIVDEGIEQPFGSCIMADGAPGCKAAIKHLIGLGHHKIGFISSEFPKINKVSGDVGSAREQLFRHEMARCGLSIPKGYVTYESTAVYGEGSESSTNGISAIEATKALLSHSAGRPSAIFCWRDETAMFAVRACQAQGLRVPQDISVVGFSDITAARLFNPPLSTIRSPWEAIGRLAVSEIQRRSSEAFSQESITHAIPTLFVARQSTGLAAF